jgi:aspartyl-tRNA synthetase
MKMNQQLYKLITDFLYEKFENFGIDVDIELECKMKDVSIILNTETNIFMDKIAVLTSADVIVINERDIAFTNEQLTKLDELRKESGTDGTLKTRIRKPKSKFVVRSF